jgi:hypothetical protein
LAYGYAQYGYTQRRNFLLPATLARRSRQHMAEPGTPEERFLKLFVLAEESA